MRISTRIIIDIESGAILERDSFEYSGPIAECKASQQQKDAANSTKAFTNTLQNQYSQEFGNSQATQNTLNSQLQGVISNAQAGNGYTQPELAALNANNTEDNANQNANAQAALSRQIQQTSGGAGLPSGAALQLRQQADSNAAANTAAGARNIAIGNAQQANSNLFSGLSGESALAGQQASSAGNLANTTGNSLNNNYQQQTQAYQPSNFFGNLASGLAGGALNAIAPGVGSIVGSGLSKALGGGTPGSTTGLIQSGNNQSLSNPTVTAQVS